MVSCRASPQGLDLPAGEGAGAVGFSRRRSSLAVGSALNQPRFDRHATAERSVANSRSQVAGAVLRYRPVNQAESVTGSRHQCPTRDRQGRSCRPGGWWWWCHLSEADVSLVRRRTGDVTRLGFAAQLATVRAIGTFLADPSAVPAPILASLARQLDIAVYPSTGLPGGTPTDNFVTDSY
jgi:hypothetical protein